MADARALTVPGVVLAALVSACGGGPASPSPSAAGALDACLVGTWRSASITGALAVSGGQVQLAGGAGEKLTVRADGTVAIDDGATAPVVGTAADGSLYQLAQSGSTTGRLSSDQGRLSVRLDDPARLTTTLTRNGVVVASQHPAAESAAYVCTRGTALTITSAGGTVSAYVPAG